MQYRLTGIGAVVIGLYVGIANPTFAQTLEASLPKSLPHQSIPANLDTLTCPDPEEAKKQLPEYKKNAVAEFYYQRSIGVGSLQGLTILSKLFFIRIYNTQSENNKILELNSGAEIEHFFRNKYSDIIEVYEVLDPSRKLVHDNPSVIIQREIEREAMGDGFSDKLISVLLDLYGQRGFGDGVPEHIVCAPDVWGPQIIQVTMKAVLEKRVRDLIEKGQLRDLIPDSYAQRN